jgi:hypothetical protein
VLNYRKLDWHAVAAVLAAVSGLVLHLLHIVDEGVLLSIILVILALVMIRDIHREDLDERSAETLERTEATLAKLVAVSSPPDTILIGSPHLREESERFAAQALGEMTWFNVCLLMFVPQPLFDVLLRPAVENPRVTSIQFILDTRERDRWRKSVYPKIEACAGREKVAEPIWVDLEESISFILSRVNLSGEVEAHMSFWGEPFMAHAPSRDVPRYIFHVQSHSELIGRLNDLARQYRMHAAPAE